ncbi:MULTISPECIES: M3 family metallopeptidase [Shewanella]|jgi:peptidyl-dipeptidase Dcp|uniref:M3 family peptidase n=1 Tax=Shewanella psychromarinicola TaxID=2487742 RepID=A0A3N4E5M0_9GAMM|nr:M3 family metallopeptidase [Shewanella psychromarinicola]AZG34712.1 M3 family peptidase [Shewanella psychromarinicola]MCL1082221.1 M3 family metallopeptidase [Shewanella psychromarinicola]RPA33499.1 M3 family peptidase [Shewanella psychromarinicola]
MRKTLITTAVSAALMLSACSEPSVDTAMADKTAAEATKTMTKAPATANNVLLTPSPLQYMAPQFDKFTASDYLPAFKQGMLEHKTEIATITNNSEPATFDNTIVALEKTGATLDRTQRVFFNLSGLISDDNFISVEEQIVPKLTAHQDNIYLDEKLFARVQVIYKNKAALTGEDLRLVEVYYDRFVRAGAELSVADKTKMRELNGELAKLETSFSQNVLKSFTADVIVIEDKAQLDGLSDSDIASLAAAAKDAGKTGYMITLVNTTTQPLLSSLKNRDVRKQLWETSAYRAMDTNAPLNIKIAQLRAQKATLLGYPTWAAYSLGDQMAKNPEAVYGILDDLAPKALIKAKVEAADIQAEIVKDGKDFKLQPWDWAYYAEKVRKAKYDLDDNQVKPYFEMNTVLNDGLFFAMNKLYGITIKPRNDLPVWHKDVSAYEVFNKDGSSIGLFYLDPYARQGKRGGAWMDELVTQSFLQNTKPVVYNALNIPKPAEGQPTLMTFDEVNTMFHEFGHAIHGLFSQVNYPSLAGTATARDFVEFPSQANEDWSVDPQVLANYAKHYQTGEPIPAELLAKVLKSHTFNQGFNTVEYLAAALLDMEWHSIAAGTEITDVTAFEQQALAKHGLDYTPVPPRYKTTYFSHSFAGGYSAGYYAYLWTEVFAADSFSYMMSNGGLTLENGQKYRDTVLSKGNSQDLMQDYIDFTGKKPTTDALLKRRGLVN